MQPRVSVIIGIYNCASTLVESLDSIAKQTYTDWEMILCDDGSTDDTLQLAREWARRDPRAKVLVNERNLGLARTLDRCIAEARGELLARQDGDDISEPDRLAKLVAALDAHPEIAVVSSWMTCFDENGVWGMVRTRQFPTAEDFLSGSPICHAPCMMRRAPVVAVGGYSAEPWVLRAQDYYLWFRLYAAGYRAMNLQEPLYRVRDDQNARSRRTLAARVNETKVRWKGFRMLGLLWPERIWAVKPILVWALPTGVYDRLRGRRLKRVSVATTDTEHDIKEGGPGSAKKTT
jgi:glycosyltransferase EpsE